VLIDPIFQAKRQRLVLGRFRREFLVSSKKPRTAIIENLDQPSRDALFDVQDRADPQVELLPVNVLIPSFVKPLPGDAAGLIVCPLARETLELGD
jgi:hypothetical protein